MDEGEDGLFIPTSQQYSGAGTHLQRMSGLIIRLTIRIPCTDPPCDSAVLFWVIIIPQHGGDPFSNPRADSPQVRDPRRLPAWKRVRSGGGTRKAVGTVTTGNMADVLSFRRIINALQL